MRPALSLLTVALAAGTGCVYQEITAEHIGRGGVIRASLNGGATFATTALADAQGDAVMVSGSAAELVFGLVAADDGAGRTGKVALGAVGGAISLPMAAGGRNKLEVYAQGTGCRAEAGAVTLRIEGDDKLVGEFDVTGVEPRGGAPCTARGALEAVPVQR